MLIRLQKYLADNGVASRRKSEEYIVNGRIRVNGAVVTELGTKINSETDVVLFDGKRVKQKQAFTYIMLNKPVGYITSSSDQFGRKTAVDLVASLNVRLFPVGRLDYDTSGLLLLTNDGGLAYKLTHPKHEIAKVYIAKIKGTPSSEELFRFREGLLIDGYKTKPAKIELVSAGKDTSDVKITITEGRNRQIRKMLDSIGHEVVALQRISVGGVVLGGLPYGKFRPLSAREVEILSNCSSSSYGKLR